MVRNRLNGIPLLILTALIALLTAGCGSNSSAPASNSNPNGTNPTMGSVVLFGKDAPICDVVSFNVTVTGATLIPQGGGTAVSVISSGSPVTIDFARLMDFSTVLNLSSVPVGTYSQLTLTLSNSQLTVLDVTQTPPAAVQLATTLTSPTVTINISPALTVAANGSAGLEFDFNLHQSAQLDANGQVTGTVTPTLTASPSHGPQAGELEEIDDLAGLVQSVSTTSTNTSFNGSFTLLTEDGTTQIVNTTSTTSFDDAAGLSNLSVGTFVEAEIFVDMNGNIVATELDAEEQEDQGQHRSGFSGLITSVVRDNSGEATQFTVFTRAELPDEHAMVPVKSSLTVSVSNSTRFKIKPREINEAGLAFNASSLGPGQEVIVHGKVRDNLNPPTVDASSVFLRPQSIRGNFVALLGKQSDDKTGGFTFVSCASVLKGQPINTFTFGDTTFVGVSGLAELSPLPTTVVRGILLYEQQSVTVNGIVVALPSLVFETKLVHQPAP